MQNELLIEIFTEDIPAKLHRQAIKNSELVFTKLLNEYNIEFESIETYVSPRRLVIRVNQLQPYTKSITETKRGPKIGANEKAIEGFLRSNNKQKSDLEEQQGYYYLTVHTSTQDITNFLADIIQEFITNMPWPKSMHWYLPDLNRLSAFWIRPIRSILCIYNDIPLELKIESVGLTTVDYTYGHRFLSNEKLTVSDFEDYQSKLEQHHVMLDFFKKRSYIEREMTQRAAAMGLVVKYDGNLLDEITGLVEYPFVHIGNIEEQFMKLPMEVLSTSMRIHQKYFTLMYPDSHVAPFFITVTNVPGNTVMYEGFERVLRARLSDAMFFYKEDIDVTLEAYAQKLSSVVFHEKLGSVSKKIERLMSIANAIEEHRVISLCKADLVTQMVGEFPELQGIMGDIYAEAQGEDLKICTAIREHYKPLGANDTLPETFFGSRVAFFDKLDTLVGFIGVGIVPTGSKDPFALRRAALSIIRLICDSQHDVLDNTELSWYIDTLINSYADQEIALLPNTKDQVSKFLMDRFSTYVSDKQKIDFEICDQIVSNYSGYDIGLKTIRDKIIKFNEYYQRPDFETIFNAYKRSKGVIGESEIDDTLNLKKLRFDNDYLIKLQNQLSNISNSNSTNITNSISDATINTDSENIYETILEVSKNVLDACENVLINNENPKIRASNLYLLNSYINIVDNYIAPLKC